MKLARDRSLGLPHLAALAVFAAAFLTLALAAAVAAAPEVPGLGSLVRATAAEDTAAAEEHENDLGRATPRGAVRGFVRAADDGNLALAAQYLELGGRRTLRGLDGPALAERLDAVLDRKLWVPLAGLSDAPEGRADDGLPPDYEVVGTISTDEGPIQVRLHRSVLPGSAAARGEALGWRFSRDTVERVPDLYVAFGTSAIEGWLPRALVDRDLFGVELWYWLALAALLAAATLAAYAIAPFVVRLLRPLSGLRRDEHLTLRVALGPVRLLLGLLLFIAGAAWLGFPARIVWLLRAVEAVLWIAGAAWLATRVLDIASHRTGQRLAAGGRHAAATMVPLGRKTFKVVVLLLALVTMLQTFGVNVTAVVAGLGIGGIAVALAAQKTVENLFGGVSLIVDQPFRVGEFCKIGDTSGTIEEIGLRSTRLRTLDRTVVSIPNGALSGMNVENFARRDKVWLRLLLQLRPDTSPDQLRDVLVEIRRLLAAHPRLEPGPRVRLVGIGTHSFDLELVAYVPTTDYNEFLAVREDLLLRLVERVQASGTDFALPAQVHVDADAHPIHEERRREAEARLAQARAAGRLGFPDLAPDEAAALAGKLDWPPRGTWLREAPPRDPDAPADARTR